MPHSFDMASEQSVRGIRRITGLAVLLALLLGSQAVAEPRPSLSPDSDPAAALGIIGPLVTSGTGADRRLVNLKTGLPSGIRGPLENSSVPTGLGADVIILQGERGAAGDLGAVGQQGPAGAPGIRGSNGLNGAPGSVGQAGVSGTDGLDAFTIWKLQSGRTNASIADYLASLRGFDGTSGSNGANGSDGLDGSDGKDAEFPEESMTGLVQSLIPNSSPQDAKCAVGEYQVSVYNSWNQSSLTPKVECRSLLASTPAPAPAFQNFGLGFSAQVTPSYIALQNTLSTPSIAPDCSVGQMFGALTLDENGALKVECLPSVYAANTLSTDTSDPGFESCGAQSFIGGLGFNAQNELIIGCVDLDLTAEQSPIKIDSQQCNTNPNATPKVMVGLTVETVEGKKIVTIQCAPLVSLQGPDSPGNNSNNGNNQNSDPEGNNGQNQGNSGNNNDSDPDGNNGNGKGRGNNVDPSQPDEEENENENGLPEDDEGDLPGDEDGTPEGEDGTPEDEEGEEEFVTLDDPDQGGSIEVRVEEVEQQQEQQSPENGLRGPSGEKGDKGDKGDTGATGEQGLSAYQVWLGLGNSGTEEDFIQALTVSSPSAQGVAGPQGLAGLNGLSAFEIWRQADLAREDLTISDFLISLQGEKGEKGDSGDSGEQGVAGPAGVAGPQGPSGQNGASAFEIWKQADAKRSNLTVNDFLISLKGEKGESGAQGGAGAQGAPGSQGAAGQNGLSAFEIWKQADSSRSRASEADFLAHLDAIPEGWSEQAACLFSNGTLQLKKCTGPDKGAVNMTILLKD